MFCGNFGYRDAARQLPTDENTVYPICSVSKSLTAAVLALLVDERLFDWHDRVADLLPGYAPVDERLRELTLAEWVSMRSGAQGYEFGFVFGDNAVVFDGQDPLTIINNLRAVRRPGTTYEYNNWGFEVAGLVIEAQTGKRWDAVLHERIIAPLGLSRVDATGALVADETADGNVTKQYSVLPDGTPAEIGAMRLSGRTMWGAAGGVHGSAADIARLYHTQLRSVQGDLGPGQTPFRRLVDTMSAHAVMDGVATLNETSYGYGWMRAQLPGPRLKVGLNYDLCGLGPSILGPGDDSRLVVWHPGQIMGANADVMLFPGPTPVTIVALSNTTARGDVIQYVVDHLIQTVFMAKSPVDYVSCSARTASKSMEVYGALVKDLERLRHEEQKQYRALRPGAPPRSLDSYVGTYANKPGFCTFNVAVHSDAAGGRARTLRFWLQDKVQQTYVLRRFCGDVFCWLMPHEELFRRGLSAEMPPSFWLVRFVVEDGAVARLVWVNDPGVEAGEVFYKR
jgi:CubicO group peptidase (beta-lactamase class C family)